MDEFAGKVAVITGGASGIGLATAKRFAREGMNVVLADIEQAALDRAVPEVSALGVDVIGVRTDVGDRDSVMALADAAFDRFGKVHLVFNNAGVAVSGLIQDMTHDDWEWLMRVNLWGVIHGVEAFTRRMIDQGEGGHILATASFAGLVPNSGLGVYCVTKYGVVALMECLYRDVSSEGIGVSVLCPMRVQTNIDSSGRNRPEELAATGAPPRLVADEPIPAGTLAGGTIGAEEVAEKVFQAVKNGELYILPHEESRGFIQRRFQRIDRVFGT
jgi:NAD(P)-dependent dehydrogenase (short-subunit alcohol dehydrogenase family)